MARSFSRNQLPVRAASNLSLVMISNGRWKRRESSSAIAPPDCLADDQTAPQITARDQFLDEQPRHDGLARAGIVSQQESQRLAGQHGFIDRRDLVRQRVDEGSVDGQHRIKQVGEPDAVRLGHQPVQRAVAIKTPRPARSHDFQTGFVVP